MRHGLVQAVGGVDDFAIGPGALRGLSKKTLPRLEPGRSPADGVWIVDDVHKVRELRTLVVRTNKVQQPSISRTKRNQKKKDQALVFLHALAVGRDKPLGCRPFVKERRGVLLESTFEIDWVVSSARFAAVRVTAGGVEKIRIISKQERADGYAGSGMSDTILYCTSNLDHHRDRWASYRQ